MSQPPPKVLSDTPPPGCEPFAFVTQQPLPETPAGCAGLAYGDVLLSLGRARHLRDVQAELLAHVGEPIPVLCVDARGRYLRKSVVPRAWDPLAPKSLLGCQMSNQCPKEHPALAGVPPPPRATHHRAPRGGGGGCLSRCALGLLSLLHLALVAAILGVPHPLPGAADLLRLAQMDCAAPPHARRLLPHHANQTERHAAPLLSSPPSPSPTAAAPSSYPPPPPPPSPSPLPSPSSSPPPSPSPSPSSTTSSATSSPLSSHSSSSSPPPSSSSSSHTSSPPSSSSSSHTSSPSSSSSSSHTSSPSSSSPPPPVAAQCASWCTARTCNAPSGGCAGCYACAVFPRPVRTPRNHSAPLPSPPPLPSAVDSPLPSASPPPPPSAIASPFAPHPPAAAKTAKPSRARASPPASPAAMLSGLEGQVDMEDMVLAITVAGGVLALTSLLGLTLACARPSSCAYSLSASLYFATSLPALAAGGFVVAYCLVFRDEADRMVQLYWRCLQSTEPPHADGVGRTAWDAAAAVYQNITLTAALLGSSELLLLLGLLAAAARVGWATVSARLLLLANTGGALLGAGLAALAGGLLARAATPFDVALLCVAVAILLVSAAGLCGARRDARLVLRLYAGLMGALSLASAGCVLLLYQLGPAGLASNAFVREHWKHVEQVYPLSQRAFEEILAHHWTKLMIAGVLVSFVLCLVTLAAAILRRSLEAAAEEPAEAEETAGLMADDDDEMA